MQNPSCLFYGPGDARFEDHPIPVIEDPLDVIVHIAYTGVCGSDVHFNLHGGMKEDVSATNPLIHDVMEDYVSHSNPLIVGHEASGIIHAIGPAVKALKPGDEVAIEPGFACRTCAQCKSGHYNLCPRMRFAANPPDIHGTLTKFFKVPADCCYKISGVLGNNSAIGGPAARSTLRIGLDEAVLIEPMAVAVHSVRQGGVKHGDRVIIFGAGTVGLLCAAVAREFGASVVVSVDVNEARLEFAQKWVSRDSLLFSTVIPDRGLTAEQHAVGLRNWVGSLEMEEDPGLKGFDVAIEATGAEMCIRMGVHVLRNGGTFVQTGLGSRDVEFPISKVMHKEITVKGCFRYAAGDFKMALDMAMLGKIDLKPLITKVVPFEDAVEAWKTTERGEGIKTLIRGVGF